MKILKVFPILLAFYEMIAYLSNDIYLPALPQLTQDLMTNHELTQLTLTTWFLGAASMQLILGPCSDRYGRRPVLLWGGVVFVIATIICAIAPEITVLLIARFFQGCAVCSVIVAGYSTVHELYEQKEAMKALALMGSITVLAPAFGPLVGSVMLKISTWRDTFWVLAILAIVALSILYKWMPESLPKDRRHPIELPVIAHNYAQIFSNPGFMLYTVAFCLTFAAMIAWIAMGPFLVIQAFHYSPMAFGLFQVMVFGSFIVGSRFVKWALERFDVNKLIFASLSIAIVGGLAALLCSWLMPNALIFFVLALMIFTFGTSLSFAPLQRLAIETSTAPMGARMAIFSGLMSGAGVLGSLLASSFYSGTTLSLALITLASAIVTLGLIQYIQKKIVCNSE
jgi:DHA1 family multidrug/chloramphenicol efflux transport protein-like MFS transporter